MSEFDEFGPRHFGHELFTPATCPCDKRSDTPCPVCDMGLGVCRLCGAAEIDLDNPCPGKHQGAPATPAPEEKRMPNMSLAAITRGTTPLPPRVVVYGAHGIGKTTFGVSAPNPIALRTEDGLAALAVPTFPLITEYAELMQALTTLYIETHDFQSLVLDSLDWLEPIVWQETARRHNESSIESFGYGKGYIAAAEVWAEVLEALNALRLKGMTIICLAHAEIKRFDAPDSEPYDRYQIKLHKRAADLIQEWADVVGFAHYEVFTESTDVGFNKKVTRGTGGTARKLAVEERPAYNAKNRFQLPAELPLTVRRESGRVEGAWPEFAAAIAAAYAGDIGAPALPASAPSSTEPLTQE